MGIESPRRRDRNVTSMSYFERALWRIQTYVSFRATIKRVTGACAYKWEQSILHTRARTITFQGLKKPSRYLAKRHFSITNQKFPETSWQPYSCWLGFSTKDSKRRYSGAQIRAKHGKKRECVRDEKRKEFRSPKTPCGKSMEELQSTSEALG